MPLKTFDTLEQSLLELQARIAARPPVGCSQKVPGIEPIHPARYDTAAISGIAKQISQKLALTDKQQVLAVKLVTKYHRQWKKAGYDVSNINLNTPTQMPLRTIVDRAHSVSAEDGWINLKFPYKPRLIGMVASYANNSRGRVTYDEKTKIWKLKATASNLKWADIFVKDHKFEITDSYKKLVKRMEDGYDYKNIQLDIVDGELVLRDAPETMLEWIHVNIGEIHMSNFIKVASASNILAFTLSNDLVDYVYQTHRDIADIILMRRSFVSSDHNTMSDLLQKINQLEYKNVVIYMPAPSLFREVTASIAHRMPGYSIVTTSSNDATYNFNSNKTVYITSRVIAVPADLIVSTAGFMAGPSRRNWFNTATKNIYYCQDIDNKIKKQLKKDESNISYKRRNER